MKRDFEKFEALTEYIIDSFGLTPQWEVVVRVNNPEELGGEHVAATTHWPAHYREVFIDTNPHWVKKRESWIKHLIHECVHVMLADLHDHLTESTPKIQQDYMVDITETAVSVIANVYYAQFMVANADVIDKLIR